MVHFCLAKTDLNSASPIGAIVPVFVRGEVKRHWVNEEWSAACADEKAQLRQGVLQSFGYRRAAAAALPATQQQPLEGYGTMMKMCRRLARSRYRSRMGGRLIQS